MNIIKYIYIYTKFFLSNIDILFNLIYYYNECDGIFRMCTI